MARKRKKKQPGPVSKSFRTAGGLRQSLSTNQPGSWASDHRAEAEHITDWAYIAIRAICFQAMQATVNVFDDSGITGERRKSQRQDQRRLWRSDPLARLEGRPYWRGMKSLYGQEQGRTEPLPDDSLIMRLMKRPNDSQSGAMFRYEQVMQLQSTGTCIVWNVPNRLGKTIARYVIPTAVAAPVDPQPDLPMGGFRVDPSASKWRSPLMDSEGFIEMTGFFSAIGKVLPVEQCQIVRWPHPILKDDGLSPMAAGARFIDLADQVNTARWSQMVNGFEPSIVILLPDDTDPTPEELEAALQKLQQKYGGALNHRKILATNGKNVVTLNTSPKDMDYSAGHKETRDAVLALLGTAPVAAGIQEAGAFAAYYASLKQFISGTCQPIFDVLAEEDTGWFSSQRPDPQGAGVIREYPEGTTVEIEAVPVDDPSLVESQLGTDITAKAISVDEVRALRGRSLWGGEKGKRIAGEAEQPPAPESGGMPQPPPPEPIETPEMPRANLAQEDMNGVDVAKSYSPLNGQFGKVCQVAKDVAKGDMPRGSGLAILEQVGLRKSEARRIVPMSVPVKEPVKEPANEYGCVYVRLPKGLANRVRNLSQQIPDFELHEKGREDEPHVTLKWGLHTDDPLDVWEHLESEGPISVRLGKINVFPDDGSRGYDVVYVEAVSPDMRRLNRKLSSKLANTTTHPEYKPHVTLAYVESGEGDKYVGVTELKGESFTADLVVFSDREGGTHSFRVSGVRLKSSKENGEWITTEDGNRLWLDNSGNLTTKPGGEVVSDESGNKPPRGRRDKERLRSNDKMSSRDASRERSGDDVQDVGEQLGSQDWGDDPAEVKRTKDAVATYTQEKGQHYKRINQSLRDGNAPAPPPDMSGLRSMEKACRQELPEPVITYRGISERVAKEMASEAGDGGFVKSKVFSSTSLSPDVAVEFAESKESSFVLEIKAKRGLYVEGITEVKNEHELIQAPNTKYKYVGTSTMKKGGETYTVVMLEED